MIFRAINKNLQRNPCIEIQSFALRNFETDQHRYYLCKITSDSMDSEIEFLMLIQLSYGTTVLA